MTQVEQAVWSASELGDSAGLTYRQVDHWVRRGLLVPSVARANGSGVYRLFSERDTRVARILAQLARTGGNVHRLLKVRDTLIRTIEDGRWKQHPWLIVGEQVRTVSKADLANVMTKPSMVGAQVIYLPDFMRADLTVPAARVA